MLKSGLVCLQALGVAVKLETNPQQSTEQTGALGLPLHGVVAIGMAPLRWPTTFMP